MSGSVQVRDRLADLPIIPIPVATTTTDKVLTSRVCLLVGWSFRETTSSAAAAAELYSGGGTGGAIVGEQQVASGGTGTEPVSDEGVLCEGGLFLHVVSGSLTGCVWVRV